MELDTLTVENFRQFYGVQEIQFSQDDGQNVTVVHGANGSSKTTILNAFLWLFYDEVTLPKPEQIPNERALAEASRNAAVDVRITLTFNHEGRAFTAERTKTYERLGNTNLSSTTISEDLTVEFVDQDGNHKRRGNPEDTLRSIMPERLREIFFFDGETIDQLSAIGGQEKIQTAIQNVMGLTILERADRHLDKARKHYESKASEHGSEELSALYEERNALEDNLEALEDEREETKSSKSEAESELEQVTDRLRELDDSRGLQGERDELEDDIASLEDDIDEIEADIADRISDDGYIPFAMPALEETAQMLREKRRQGEIPTEIKTQFVDDLLEIEECICGRDLVPGSDAYDSVASWRERAGSSELEETAMKIVGRLSEIGEGEEELYDDIEESLRRRGEKKDTKQQKQERVSEISSALSDVNTEDIAELEARRTDLEDEIGDYERKIGRLEGEIDSTETELEDLSDDVETAEEENEKANLARRRASTAEYLRNLVRELFERYQDNVRTSVNDRVNISSKRSS